VPSGRPAIDPAFRVRRGNGSKEAEKTGRARRATRPTSCLFRDVRGRASRLRPVAKRVGAFRSASALASPVGESRENPRGRAGTPTRGDRRGEGKRCSMESSADARGPTTSSAHGREDHGEGGSLALPSAPQRPGSTMLPPCSPPSRPSPSGACGSLDGGCARRRGSIMGRDGRMGSRAEQKDEPAQSSR